MLSLARKFGLDYPGRQGCGRPVLPSRHQAPILQWGLAISSGIGNFVLTLALMGAPRGYK